MHTKLFLLAFLTLFSARAQNLIQNGDFEAGNTAFSNDYVYSAVNLVPEGTYSVVKNPHSVHGSWASFGDHTSGSGLMLAANGSPNPTNVVWRQTVAVTPNTKYLFSAWAASSYPISPSEFHFIVNGEPQGNVVALPPATGVWQNYSAFWESSNAVSAKLEVRMLNTAFNGNDLVLDDLSFRRVNSSIPLPGTAINIAVQIRWVTVTNQLYQVQWANTVNTNQWFSLGNPVGGNGGTNVYFDAVGTNYERFYRVIPVD